jgi:hypothetical protein
MNEHLSLGQPIEISLGYQWICPKCKEKLRSEKSPQTNWQTWYFTSKGKRHYKNKCKI